MLKSINIKSYVPKRFFVGAASQQRGKKYSSTEQSSSLTDDLAQAKKYS